MLGVYYEIFSYFVNLVRVPWHACNNESLSLPNLKILKARQFVSDVSVNLIKNTVGNLSEISILCDDTNNKRLIQVIYQNCPNLGCLKLSLVSNISIFISEFENILINCQL